MLLHDLTKKSSEPWCLPNSAEECFVKMPNRKVQYVPLSCPSSLGSLLKWQPDSLKHTVVIISFNSTKNIYNFSVFPLS